MEQPRNNLDPRILDRRGHIHSLALCGQILYTPGADQAE
jgi:hypothetical protein